MMEIMFDEECDPDEDMSGESIFGDWHPSLPVMFKLD